MTGEAAKTVRIWVDADACPRAVKELLFRAAQRRGAEVTLVANAPMAIPPSPRIRLLLVPAGADKADQRIAEEAEPGDLVVTADVPLAAAVVAKGIRTLDPRGTVYTEENVGERLAMRNLLETLRGGGLAGGGPASPDAGDLQRFANALDRALTGQGL